MKRIYGLVVCAMFALWAISAQAQLTVSDAATPVFVGTSAAQCVRPAPYGTRGTLLIFNVSENAIYYGFTSGVVAVDNTPGSIPIPSHTGKFWQKGNAPINAIYCISGTTNSGLTVQEGN